MTTNDTGLNNLHQQNKLYYDNYLRNVSNETNVLALPNLQRLFTKLKDRLWAIEHNSPSLAEARRIASKNLAEPSKKLELERVKEILDSFAQCYTYLFKGDLELSSQVIGDDLSRKCADISLTPLKTAALDIVVAELNRFY